MSESTLTTHIKERYMKLKIDIECESRTRHEIFNR